MDDKHVWKTLQEKCAVKMFALSFERAYKRWDECSNEFTKDKGTPEKLLGVNANLCIAWLEVS